MITVTFGAGGTYANWPALFAGVFNSHTLTDDVTCNQVGNIVGGGTASMTNCNFNFKTVIFRATVSPLGDPNAGFSNVFATFTWISIAADGGNTNPGTLIFDSLKFSSTSGSPDLISIGDSFGGFAGMHLQFSNIIGASSGGGRLLGMSGTIASALLFNVASNYQVHVNANTITAENCIFGFVSLSAAVSGILNNVYSPNAFGALPNFVVSYCATAAATIPGTHGQVLQSAATSFLSVDFTSSDFYKLAPASILNYSGGPTFIPANTLGIRGNARPHGGGFFSIGADEGSAVPARTNIFPGIMP